MKAINELKVGDTLVAVSYIGNSLEIQNREILRETPKFFVVGFRRKDNQPLEVDKLYKETLEVYGKATSFRKETYQIEATEAQLKRIKTEAENKEFNIEFHKELEKMYSSARRQRGYVEDRSRELLKALQIYNKTNN